MAAVGRLDDRFARVAITVLRHTGLRVGELLDLELEDLVDYGTNGTWLRVPLGKLNNERSVPADDAALEALDEWLTHRAGQRARPHPRDGHLADFIFVERGRRIGTTRIQRGLRGAVIVAGLTGTDGEPLRVVAHQLRHTWATEFQPRHVDSGPYDLARTLQPGDDHPLRPAHLPDAQGRLRPGRREDRQADSGCVRRPGRHS